MADTSYHGNSNLKPIGHDHDFTEEQVKEILKCREDPVYFIENYCHIVTLDQGLQLFKLYECQKEKVDIMSTFSPELFRCGKCKKLSADGYQHDCIENME